MTVSVKAPTSTTGSIQLNGSDVLTIDSSGNLTAPNNITVNGNLVTDTNTFYVDATNNAVLAGKTSIDYTTVGFEATPSSIYQANAMTGDGVRPLLVARKTNDGELIQFRRDTTQVGSIGAASGGIYFGSGTSSTERMRIDSGGNVHFGATDPGSVGYGTTYVSPSGGSYWRLFVSSTVNKNQITFNNPNGEVGRIITGGTSTSFLTSSDYRLKENNVNIADGISRVKLLKPYRFNFIADADKTVDGFFAHEVQDVVPEAIAGTKDEVDNDGNPVYQGIDQSKLVPLLTSALQEAITKIEDLETRIQALENPNG